jgi:hypothetical protein
MLRNIFGNWQLNGITTLQSGIPMNVSIATDTAENTSSSGTYRPNLVHAPRPIAATDICRIVCAAAHQPPGLVRHILPRTFEQSAGFSENVD